MAFDRNADPLPAGRPSSGSSSTRIVNTPEARLKRLAQVQLKDRFETYASGFASVSSPSRLLAPHASSSSTTSSATVKVSTSPPLRYSFTALVPLNAHWRAPMSRFAVNPATTLADFALHVGQGHFCHFCRVRPVCTIGRGRSELAAVADSPAGDHWRPCY